MSNHTEGGLKGFGGTVIAQAGRAFVETLDAPGGDLFAIHLTGTHYEMGRQYGTMLGEKILTSCEVMKAMLRESGLADELISVVGSKSWARCAKYIPDIYRQELAGIVDAANEAGVLLSLDLLETIAAIPEFTSYGNMEEMIGQLLEEPQENLKPVWDGKERSVTPITCSAFMAWGDRCENGNLYGCRNLDWSEDTGMAGNKCVTVFHPVNENGEPGIPSAIFGYIGLLGAMAGINAEGIALSEIGAVNARETFDGRPWHYVFREILDSAANIDETVSILKKGNFLQGYCFTAGWGDPRRKGTPAHAPQGISVEVDAVNTEILYDDDPQERNAVCVDANGDTLLFNGEPVYYGLPLKNAVFRADTAFSKSVRSGQRTDKGPANQNNSGNATEGRTWKTLYKPISLMIQATNEGKAFDLAGIEKWHFTASNPHPMTREDALNICKMAGDNDSNVMSIFYDATNLKVGVAFETGTGETWTPASTAGYVDLDLSEVFQ